MTVNDGIRVEAQDSCLLCGEQGHILYRDLRDSLYSVPGTWNYVQCSRCDLAWLNPRPIAEDAGKAYQTFFTHEVDPPKPRMQRTRNQIKLGILATALGYRELPVDRIWKWVGRVVSFSPNLREMAGVGVRYLHREYRGRLVDVGAGNGEYVGAMARLGWDVQAIEPDVQAVAVIRKRFGIPAFAGTLEQAGLPSESADVLVMNHVIEHVHDPIHLLRECGRVLRPRGQLVVVTPNIRSLAHRYWGSSWRGLEPSRHLYLFSLGALRRSVEAAGFEIRRLRTSASSARYMYAASGQIRKRGLTEFQPPLTASSLAFGLTECLVNACFRTAGEEIALVAVKRESC